MCSSGHVAAMRARSMAIDRKEPAPVTSRGIVTGGRIDVPASGRHFVEVLEKNAPHNESTKTSSR
jgi:hypothetical protein